VTYLQRSLLALVPIVVALLSASSAWADEPADTEASIGRDSSSFGLGLAVGSRERPYKGLDSDIRVLPVISYENSWVRVQGLGAAFKLGNAGKVSFGLKVDYSLNGATARARRSSSRSTRRSVSVASASHPACPRCGSAGSTWTTNTAWSPPRPEAIVPLTKAPRRSTSSSAFVPGTC